MVMRPRRVNQSKGEGVSKAHRLRVMLVMWFGGRRESKVPVPHNPAEAGGECCIRYNCVHDLVELFNLAFIEKSHHLFGELLFKGLPGTVHAIDGYDCRVAVIARRSYGCETASEGHASKGKL